MPPRKHYAKSQEFVYKSVGKGSRQKFRLVVTDIPRHVGTSTNAAHEDASLASLPTVVSAPLDADCSEQSQDHSYFDNVNDYTEKKSGKVSATYRIRALTDLKTTLASEAIRLHEDLVEGEKGKVFTEDHRNGGWTKG